MALNHDNQGFLVGERLDAEDITGRLDAIRNEVAALRRDISGSNASPVARPRQVERVEAGPDHAAGSPSSEPGAVSSEARRNEVVIRIDRPAVAATPPDRQAPGRYVYRAAQAAGSEGVASAASPSRSASQVEPGTDPSQPVARATARPATPSPGAGRDAGGRFVRRSEAASPSGRQRGDGSPRDDDEDGGRLSMAVDGMGRRLSDAVQEMGAGTEEADPAVKAFNEVAQPLSRGFGKIMGGDSDRNQERWYRRFWRMMRRKNRDDEQEGKRQRRILKNIERKPVSDGGGSMLWRGVLLLLAPITAMLSLLGALPLAIAGALASSLKWLLTAMGMSSMARRIPVPGGRRAGGRHTPRTAVPPAAAAGQAGRQSRAAGAVPPGAGSSPPGRGGRIGGALRQGARRIPGIGALLGLGFMASDVAASERSDASREEKNVTTGRAVGGGLGGIGGMAGGAAAGAALGSVVPVIGTAVGGVVGTIAGGFFGGSAGEVLGEKAGQWLNRLQDTPIIQGMSDSWHYAADFTSALWGRVSEAASSKWEDVTAGWQRVSQRIGDSWEAVAGTISERWQNVTASMQARWESAVALAARGWEALSEAAGDVNDWIREKTGIDVGQAASDAAGWVSDTAVSSAEWTAERAGRARDWVSERAGVAAARASEAASRAAEGASEAAASAWERTQQAGGWIADKTGLSTAADWVRDSAREAGENRQSRRNAAAAEPALVAAMAEAGITDANEQAAFMGQMHHESNGFRSLEESFRYSSADRIMEVSRTARQQGREAVEAAMAQGPEAVAELMYGGRMGNTEAGDGYRYRGRGYTQLTGRDNYTAASEALGIDLVNNPDLAADPEVAARVATWYWQNRAGLSEAAQRGDAREVTRLINGGHNGLEDRRNQTDRYLAAARAGELSPTGAVPAGSPAGAPMLASQSVQTAHLVPMGLAANGPPAGVTPPPAAHVPAPSMPRVAEAPTVSAPLSPPSSHDGDRRHGGQGQDVSRDVSDRRIAHIVTGAYSGMS
ncbi:glycoside hydrolase family 19 protein [Halomonas sp. E14]|uniref:glycoside hydrolase family 19 protein n=1 Tax=Halomonas sp. E14 TaxID=3397245 RepID=UPI00403EC63C